MALTPSKTTARHLALYWGVFPAAMSRLKTDSFDDLLRRACSVALDKASPPPLPPSY